VIAVLLSCGFHMNMVKSSDPDTSLSPSLPTTDYNTTQQIKTKIVCCYGDDIGVMLMIMIMILMIFDESELMIEVNCMY
jgi:hypothetical protein